MFFREWSFIILRLFLARGWQVNESLDKRKRQIQPKVIIPQNTRKKLSEWMKTETSEQMSLEAPAPSTCRDHVKCGSRAVLLTLPYVSSPFGDLVRGRVWDRGVCVQRETEILHFQQALKCCCWWFRPRGYRPAMQPVAYLFSLFWEPSNIQCNFLKISEQLFTLHRV